MSKYLKVTSLFLALSIISTTGFASIEGSFRGESSKQSILNLEDHMALIIKKDQSTTDKYHVLLAEYDVLPASNIIAPNIIGKNDYKYKNSEDKRIKQEIVSWVPRAALYQATRINDTEYSLAPLRVNDKGGIEANTNVKADILKLATADSLKGAVLTRFDKKNSKKVSETVKLDGTLVNSTWEPFVAGKFWQTKVSSGLDYKIGTDRVNTEIAEDGTMKVDQKQNQVKGLFKLTEVDDKMFTISSIKEGNIGEEKLLGKIGIFIDIVNWKFLGAPKFTTEELFTVDPENEKNLGFYYERHGDKLQSVKLD